MEDWIYGALILAALAWAKWSSSKFSERIGRAMEHYESNRNDVGARSFFYREALQLLNDISWLLLIIGALVVWRILKA